MIEILGNDERFGGIGLFGLGTEEDVIEIGGNLRQAHQGGDLREGERVTSVVFTWSDFLESMEFKTSSGRSFKFGGRREREDSWVPRHLRLRQRSDQQLWAALRMMQCIRLNIISNITNGSHSRARTAKGNEGIVTTRYEMIIFPSKSL